MNNVEQLKEQYTFIYNAINDTQETIRFTDTKSGAVIIVVMGLIAGLVTLIDRYYTLLKQFSIMPKSIAILGGIYFLICLFISLILSLRSINPANNPNYHIDMGDWTDKPNIKYYLSGLNPSMRWEDYLWELKDSRFRISASEYYKNVLESNDSDFLKALTLELLKISYIKEKKINRTKVAIKWVEKSIWTAGLTTIMALITHNTKVTPLWSIKNLDYNIFLYLIVGHVVGDFLLQTSWQAENKGRIWRALISHGLVYSIAIYIITLIVGSISLISIAIIFISHILLDKGHFVNWWIENIKKEQTDDERIRFIVDQSLHLLVLLIITMLN